MKNLKSLFVYGILVHFILSLCSGEIQIENAQMQVKKSGLTGELEVTLAQWDLTMTEDVYYYEGPPCAAGTARAEVSQSAVNSDPCWAGCNFALKGDRCGEPFNSSDPACRAFCDNYPDRDLICDSTVYDWVEMLPDVETELTNIEFGQPVLFRMNWLLVEQGYRLEVVEFVGNLGSVGYGNFSQFQKSVPCLGGNHPDPWAQLCPSMQCYAYGTHFFSLYLDSEQGLYDYRGTFSVVARTFKVPTPPLPSEIPETFPTTLTPFHAPLEFGKTLTLDFAPTEASRAYQLTTNYCGLINIQAEASIWYRRVCHFALGISTSFANPFPGSIYSDIVYADASIKPIYICPTPENGNVAVMFMLFVRYLVDGDPPLSTPERFYLTIDTLRNTSDWKRFRLGATPQDFVETNGAPPLPQPFAGDIFTKHAPFPVVGNFQSGFAANALTLTCPKSVVEFEDTIQFLCRSGSAYFGTCINFFAGFPSDPFPTSMIPIPPIIKDFDLQFFSNLDYRQPAVQAKSLSAVLLLNLEFDKVARFQYDANWDMLIDHCTLSLGLGSPFADLNGSWPIANLQLTRSQPACDLTELQALVNAMNENVKDLELDPSSAYSQRTKTDLLTFHDPWQGCLNYVQNNITIEEVVERQLNNSEFCFEPTAGDPCCDTDASWDHCCTPRTVSGNVTFYASDNTTTAQCGNPSCVEPLLDQYSFANAFQELGGCIDAELKDEGMIALRSCLITYFGDDYINTTCIVDSDCPRYGLDPTVKCDVLQRVCVQSYESARIAFFDCLAQNLPPPIRIALLKKNKWSLKKDTLSELLAGTYGSMPRCIQTTGTPWSLINWHLSYYAFNECPACPLKSADPTRQIPAWCDVRYSSCTVHITDDFRPQSLCGVNATTCNVANSANNCASSTSVCGICETDSSCYEITNPQASTCQDNVVCVLANGTIRTDLTASQCNNTFSCSLPCPGGVPCQSEQACEAVGYCQFREYIFEGIAASPWTLGMRPPGFCVFQMAPNNFPDCSIFYTGSLPTSYGCVVFTTNCTSTTPIQCDLAYMTEPECTSAGGQWYSEQVSKSECLSTTRCSKPVTIPSISRIGSTLLSPKDAEECANCGGEIIPLSTWVGGRWLPGTARAASTFTKAVVPYETPSSLGIDFRSLFLEVYDSTVIARSYQIQNNLQCTYSGIQFAVVTAVCDCTTSLSKKCYPLNDAFQSGRGRICPDAFEEVISYPTIISSDNTSLSSSLMDDCLDFRIVRIASQQFAKIKVASVTTGFVHRPKSSESTQTYETVENSNGAIVGQVVGDAVELDFNNLGRYLRHLEICVAPNANIAINQAKYPVPDFGLVTSNSLVVALGTSVEFSEGYYCANFTFNTPNGQPATTFAVLPIQRKVNYQDPSSERLSSGETALLYIVASLYAFLFAAITIQVIRLIALGSFSLAVATNTLWLVFALMATIRAVYFYLVPANVLGQPDQHGLVDFWMIDLPVLLYLLGSILLCFSFLFLYLATKKPHLQEKKYYWAAVGLATAFLVCLFVAVLLAFNYAVIDGQGNVGSEICPTIVDNSTNATIIRIVYECILLSIALTIALVSLILSSEISNQLKALEGSSSVIILRVGICSSFGIIADSLAFLIYYSIDSPSPYFAIVLIFTEILPILFILIILSNHQIRQKKQSNSSRTTAESMNSGSRDKKRTHAPQFSIGG